MPSHDNLQMEPMVPELRQPRRISKQLFTRVIVFAAPIVALIAGMLIGVYTMVGSDLINSTAPIYSLIDVKKILFEDMKSENIKANLRILSEKVHVAGTPQEEEILVDLIVNRWKQQLDEVQVYPYDVLLSMPNDTDPNYVAVRNADNQIYDKSDIYEPALSPDENFTDIPVTFNAYGAAGHVEGDVVFVNFARSVDFKMLNESFQVDVRGKICIAKYGKLFRGDKADEAEIHGCAGLIIFTDPADYGPNSTFPDSWWMPHSGVQRGTLNLKNGDFLTPFFPANEYAYRIPENESGINKIPVHPISADNAWMFLSKLGGRKAPDDWQGGMNITYMLGGEMAPGYNNHKFVLHVGNFRPMRRIKNIVGIIWGDVEPDRHVIIGNHRDAWVFGAVDPSSGTAAMLEVARAMGELVKSGRWRPRRTIMFCSWSAEEYGVVGSVEWVEEFEKKLLQEAVTYLNVDIAIQGQATFRAKATPNIRKLLFEVTKGVENPDPNEIEQGRPTVYDTWKKVFYDKENKSQPFVMPLGSGSDFLMFIQKTGVSSVDLRYTYDQINLKLPSYPIYHSAHETIKFVEEFLDPDYRFSLAVAQIWCDLARRIADDVIIPFAPLDYANEVRKMLGRIAKDNAGVLKEHGVALDHLNKVVGKFTAAAQKLDHVISQANTSNPLAVRQINDKIMYLERSFLDFNGLPGRQQFRHIVYAPSTRDSYLGDGFPGFVDAIYDAKLDGNWENVKKQLATITHHLASASTVLVPL